MGDRESRGVHEKRKGRSKLVVAVGRERRGSWKWRAKLNGGIDPHADGWSPKPKAKRSEGNKERTIATRE